MTVVLYLAGALGVMVVALLALMWRPSQDDVVIDMRSATQIVLQWPGQEIGIIGLWQQERRLIEDAAGLYFEDGNDVGAGAMNVFLYADDPDAAVARLIENVRRGRIKSAGLHIGVARYNADRTDWVHEPVYPPGLRSFDLSGRNRATPP